MTSSAMLKVGLPPFGRVGHFISLTVCSTFQGYADFLMALLTVSSPKNSTDDVTLAFHVPQFSFCPVSNFPDVIRDHRVFLTNV